MGFCLTSIEMKRLLAGDLPEGAATRARQHMEECDRCGQEFRSLEKRQLEEEDKASDPKSAETETEHPKAAEPPGVSEKPDEKTVPAHGKAPGTAKKTKSEESPAPAKPSEFPRSTKGKGKRVRAAKIPKPGSEGKSESAGDSFALPGYQLQGDEPLSTKATERGAVRLATGADVRITILADGSLGSERERSRFLDRLGAVRRVRHSVLTIPADGGIEGTRGWIASDIQRGISLEEWLDTAPDARKIVELIRQVAAAVESAHHKGVHTGALSMDSLRVEDDGNPRLQPIPIWSLDQPRLCPCSPPEAVLGGEFVWDSRSDVYALAAILYRALAGTHAIPESSDRSEQIRMITQSDPKFPLQGERKVDRDLQSVVQKGLRREQEERYGTAGEFRAELERWLGGRSVDARNSARFYVFFKALRNLILPG